MDLLNLFTKHRSIRNYKTDPLPWDRLREIIEAASRGTSSSGNLNSYSIILTTSQEKREQLWKLHLEQDFIRQAPCVLTFLADFNRTRLWLKREQADDGFNDFQSFLVASFDAMLLSQSIALAAEAEGWGICYLGTTTYCMKELQDLFNLPSTVVPVTSLVMGYPDETPEVRKRLPLEAYLHEENYKNYSPDDIDRLFVNRNGDLKARYANRPELVEKLKSAGVENLAQFYTSEFKYHPPVMRNFARKIKDFIKKNDFDFNDSDE